MVPNMALVKEFCEEEGLPFREIDKRGNLLEVQYQGKPYLFTYTTTPFNREDVQHVCNDKFLTYELLHSKLALPKTKKYLRPDLNPNWHDKIEFGSAAEIARDIEQNFSFPFIIKPNTGSLGRNIFVCRKVEEVERAVNKIFEEDWALLAQELIEKDQEFRVLIVNNSVELVYPKGGGEFLTDLKEIKEFLAPLADSINLGWAGLDVLLDKAGKLWLIEINTKPSLISAIKLGQQEKLKLLYKKAFQEILG
jgi:glutathione synthase/RimK-type ligase-like ATP-grasp enzyme